MMKKSELSRYIDRLESGKILEIRKNGIDDFEIVKEISSIPEANFPLQHSFHSTSFLSINTVGFKHGRNFGVKPTNKRKDNNSYNISVITGVFEMLLDSIPVIQGKFKDNNGINYTTKKVGEYTGFYAYDRLYYILFNGKKYLIPNKVEKLETKTFKNLQEVR